MKRKLSQKELRFLKELESLLSRNGASISTLNKRVTFFIDNVEEGDCLPTVEHVDATSLSRLIRKGKARLDWKQPEQYNAKAKAIAIEKFYRGVRYECRLTRSAWTTPTISVDDRKVSRPELKQVTKVVFALRVDTKYLERVSTILNDMNAGAFLIEPVVDRLAEISTTDLRVLLEIKRLIPSAEICKICKSSLSPIF